MSSREFAEWIAYGIIEPTDPERSDARTALVCQTMSNLWRGKNKKAYKLSDFLLKFGGGAVAPVRKSVKEIKMKLNMWRKGYQKQKDKEEPMR